MSLSGIFELVHVALPIPLITHTTRILSGIASMGLFERLTREFRAESSGMKLGHAEQTETIVATSRRRAHHVLAPVASNRAFARDLQQNGTKPRTCVIDIDGMNFTAKHRSRNECPTCAKALRNTGRAWVDKCPRLARGILTLGATHEPSVLPPPRSPAAAESPPLANGEEAG